MQQLVKEIVISSPPSESLQGTQSPRNPSDTSKHDNECDAIDCQEQKCVREAHQTPPRISRHYLGNKHGKYSERSDKQIARYSGTPTKLEPHEHVYDAKAKRNGDRQEQQNSEGVCHWSSLRLFEKLVDSVDLAVNPGNNIVS